MPNANSHQQEKEVVQTASFSYWAERLLPWLIHATLLAPCIPLALPRLGVLLDTTAIFRLLAWGAGVCAVAVAMHAGLRLRRTPIMVSLVSIFLALLLATVLAVDRYRALWGDVTRQEGLLHAGALFAFGYASLVAFRNRHALYRHLQLTVAISLFFGIWAVVSPLIDFFVFAGDVPSQRLWGVYVNPLFFGDVMLISACIALVCAGNDTRRAQRVLFSVTSIGLAVMALFSGSRSILLSGLAILWCLVFFVIRIQKRWSMTRILIGTLLVGGMVLIIAGVVHSITHTSFPLLSRITSVSFTDQRLSIWRLQVPGIGERPFFGWGPEGQLLSYYRHFDPNLYAQTFEIFDRAHNIVLDLLVTGGIVLLISTILFVFTLFQFFWKQLSVGRERILILGALCATVAHVVYLQFVFDSIFSWTVLVPLIAGACAPYFFEPHVHRRPRLSVVFIGILAVCCVATTVILPVFALYQSRTAYLAFQKSPRAGGQLYMQAYNVRSVASTEVAKMFGTAIREAIDRGDRSEDIREVGVLVKSILEREATVHPWDPSIPMAQARLFEALEVGFPGSAQPVRELLMATIMRHPWRMEPLQMLALRELRDGRLENAEALLRYTISLNREVGEPYLQLAAVLARAGRIDEARAMVGIGAREDYNISFQALRMYGAIIRSSGAMNLDAGGVMETGNVPTQ